MIRIQWPAKVLLITGLCLFITGTAHAITTISQGYASTDALSMGTIVSLQQNSADKVSAAKSSEANSLFGVVISDGSSLLSLSDGKASQVQVATSGIVQVLVSDINGTVNEGDQITASPISGVGMKATSSTKVIGTSQGSLSAGNSSAETYTDKSKQQHNVKLGQVPVLINVSYYYRQPEKTIIPSAFQNVANALAGKPVSPVPILISLGIFVITLIVVVSIIYSIIHSSIISVGRNPMSQSAIYRNIIQLSALVVAILGVSVVSIYMVLTKFS